MTPRFPRMNDAAYAEYCAMIDISDRLYACMIAKDRHGWLAASAELRMLANGTN